MNDRISLQKDEVQPTSLRERKKRLVQITIEETALRLFQQRGYEQTSIQDIAETIMMSTRTFFRYFTSKEEVLFGPMRATLNEGIHFLQESAPLESSHIALKATFIHLAHLYQEKKESFLIRYRVAIQTPSIASAYVYALLEIEPAICDTLYTRLGSNTNRREIYTQVAIYMTAFRLALVVWLEQEAQADLAALLCEHLGYVSSFAQPD